MGILVIRIDSVLYQSKVFMELVFEGLTLFQILLPTDTVRIYLYKKFKYAM